MLFVEKNFATDMKYPFETLGGAVAALDYDRDGWVDLLFLNGAPSPEHLRTDPASFNRLFRNTGKGQFVDVTLEAGLSGAGIKGYPQGVAVGDYDNDGYVDVLVTNYGDNVLYHNDGNGRFTDVTAKAGVAMPRHPLKASAAWLDFDNDGWLDLFVTHYFQWTFAEDKDVWCGRQQGGHRIYCDPDVFKPLPNVLLRNNRDGTFTDVSEPVGLNQYLGKGMGVAVADYDGDGRMDVFVTQRPGAPLPVPQRRRRQAPGRGVRGRGRGQRVGRHGLGHGLRLRGLRRRRLARHLPVRPRAGRLHPLRQPGQGVLRGPDVPVRRRDRPRRRTAAGASRSSTSTTTAGRTSSSPARTWSTTSSSTARRRSTRRAASCIRNVGEGRIEDLSERVGPDITVAGAWRGVAAADFDNDGALEVAVNQLNGPPRSS